MKLDNCFVIDEDSELYGSALSRETAAWSQAFFYTKKHEYSNQYEKWNKKKKVFHLKENIPLIQKLRYRVKNVKHFSKFTNSFRINRI